ncbi:DNA mismatch repair protein Mlh1 [Dispira simplex]|nr:DNA mismatch repair protein Mlh1 [Dispira simplex]
MEEVPPTLKPIRRLDETVVNRIAAGEIIHRPANALKELLENSLDAGATNIQVLIKEGGLKVLQIQDNGHGIRLDDLPIVCERFTTSKLQAFEDLNRIQTFGFRGEALASISHIAHVTVTSRTPQSNCAYRACYSDGKLTPAKPGAPVDPRPCAGNVGTQITVEDLFYNVPFRRKALKNISDEYNRILDVMNRYAIRNAGVCFTCKKLGQTVADLHTASGMSKVDIIAQIYGAKLKPQLLKVECHPKEPVFQADGYITHANYSVKRSIFILFINQRLVDSLAMKKAVEQVYQTLLPKGGHPFVYLELTMNPEFVDVNVHPTKREVHFLKEDEIIATITEAIQSKLATTNDSRSFQVQSVLSTGLGNTRPSVDSSEGSLLPRKPYTPTRVYDHQFVRTDTRTRTLKDFAYGSNQRTQPHTAPVVMNPADDMDVFMHGGTRRPATKPSQISVPVRSHLSTSSQQRPLSSECETPVRRLPPPPSLKDSSSTRSPSVPSVTPKTSPPSRSSTGIRPKVEVQLTSILELRTEVREAQHAELTQILGNHTLVGLVDYERVLLQYETRLYMVNYVQACEELFYQRFLWQFCNFGAIQVDPPASISELMMVALLEEKTPDSISTPDMNTYHTQAQILTDIIVGYREMLDEYFYMIITSDGQLATLPLVIPGYNPNLLKLPLFLLRLATAVNWESEKPCFKDLCREFAKFYSPAPPLPLSVETHIRETMPTSSSPGHPDLDKALDKAWDSPEIQTYRDTLQHTVFPCFKAHFYAPASLVDTQTTLQLADLPDLYKIFERC